MTETSNYSDTFHCAICFHDSRQDKKHNILSYFIDLKQRVLNWGVLCRLRLLQCWLGSVHISLLVQRVAWRRFSV